MSDSPSSSVVHDLPILGSDQVINGSPTALPPPPPPQVDKITPPPISFAQAARKSLAQAQAPKATARAQWAQVRSSTETKEWLDPGTKYPVYFSHHKAPYMAAIPYDKDTHFIGNVIAAVKTIDPAPLGMSYRRPGIIFLCFDSEKKREEALAKPLLSCIPAPLRMFPVCRSRGTRIKIRVDEMTTWDIEERRELLQELFQPYGKILHINAQYMGGIMLDSMEFILEVPRDSPKDLRIPRVAALEGSNTMFAWEGTPFCYKCGREDHTKPQCPMPWGFDLQLAPPLETPLLARAFPDLSAPPRPHTPKTANKVAARTSAKQKATANNNAKNSEWNLVDRSRKRGRDTSLGGGATSASDGESSSPPKKIPPRPLPKESPPAPMQAASQVEPTPSPALVRKYWNKKDTDVVPTPSPMLSPVVPTPSPMVSPMLPSTLDLAAGLWDEEVDQFTNYGSAILTPTQLPADATENDEFVSMQLSQIPPLSLPGNEENTQTTTELTTVDLVTQDEPIVIQDSQVELDDDVDDEVWDMDTDPAVSMKDIEFQLASSDITEEQRDGLSRRLTRLHAAKLAMASAKQTGPLRTNSLQSLGPKRRQATNRLKSNARG
ncbi:hypothetical protein BGW38_004859 [Lunasporangiospora selenospora]|uniref:CCHC-type domain-containing protein n=1 Tax=Lunasporangiospora selenospora TaxID=979761 RepID=A0A9P6FQP9_9FUNG|nr:hypothetical protein BGW38_004859 [Lunasporangiospora selenospora]